MKTKCSTICLVFLCLGALLLVVPERVFAEVNKTVKQKEGPVFDRFITIGFGIHSGYFYAGGSTQVEADSRLIYGFDAHLRLFTLLGVSISYDLNAAQLINGSKVPLPFPSLRLIGHLYIAQSGPMYLNLLGGLGFNFTNQNGGEKLAAYILGAELGFKINKRFTIGGTFRFLLPSYERALKTIPSQNPALSSTLVYSPISVRQMEIIDRIFDFQNVQIDVTLRVFL